nr:transposase [Allobaculum mucilyticum]
MWVNVFDPNGERTYNAHFKTWLNEYELRELLLSISDDLTEAYEMRNTLSEFFRNGTKADAADRLQVILADLNRSQVKELNAFGQTVVNWFREIVNSFEIVKTEYVVDKKNGKARRKDHRLTSSMIENRNKLVKQIKNNANGYTNWKRFRNRVLYVLNRPAFRLEPFEKEDKESNDSPGSPLNKNEVLIPQAFEKLVGIKTSTKFRAPQKQPDAPVQAILTTTYGQKAAGRFRSSDSFSILWGLFLCAVKRLYASSRVFSLPLDFVSSVFHCLSSSLCGRLNEPAFSLPGVQSLQWLKAFPTFVVQTSRCV